MSTEVLPALPSQFKKAAIAFCDKVTDSLAKMEDPRQKAELLAKADTLTQFAHRIRQSVDAINPIQLAKLRIIDSLAESLPRGKAGRGKKSAYPLGGFAKATVTHYRKIGDHGDKIDEYWRKVQEHNGNLPTDDPAAVEMTEAGFLRFLGSDGMILRTGPLRSAWWCCSSSAPLAALPGRCYGKSADRAPRPSARCSRYYPRYPSDFHDRTLRRPPK